MLTPVQRVLAAAGDPPLLHPGDAVVVLVSGGRDSVCLLDLLATVCGPDRLLALHVNYGLRGPESDGDEDHVRRLCQSVGVDLDVLRAPAAPSRGNLQSWARDLRYAEAVSRARDHAARIAAGHTATDQVETILYRLAASPGRRALLGMAPVDGILIRPLLGVTRELTGDYCRERGLDWREDSTNSGGAYARNRARHGLAAALGQLHPAASANVARTARLLRDEAAVLDEVVTATLAGRDRISVDRLAELSPALGRLVVIRMAEDAGGRLVPGAGRRVPELLGLAPRGGSGRLDVGGGVRAVVEYGILRFEPDRRRTVPDPVGLPIPGTARFGGWQLESSIGPPTVGPISPDPGRADRSAGTPAAGSTAAVTNTGSSAGGRGAGSTDAVADTGSSAGGRGAGSTDGSTSSYGGGIGWLDADLVESGGLTVRAWRAGDRISPLGLGGTKSLADLFTDHRIPRSQRCTLPVVACGPEVAWVPGLATGERFRVSARTTRVVVLRAHTAPDPPAPGH